jgi:hypothetical protein
MRDRVVSLSSLAVVIASALLFLVGAWSVFNGSTGVGDGVMAATGWLLAAVVFAYRSADPAYLDPVSIVKGR